VSYLVDPAGCWALVALALAIGTVLSTIELLGLAPFLFAESRLLWRESAGNAELRGMAAIDAMGLVALLVVRPLAALGVAATAWQGAPSLGAAILLLLCTLLKNRRLVLLASGGDTITLATVAALTLHAWRPADGRLATVALAFVAFQAVLAYFANGCAKARYRGWRSGEQLRISFGDSLLGSPGVGALLAAHPGATRLASWAVIVFQIGFPLAIVAVPACALFLAVGVLFHLAIALALRLTSFLWPFLATYPAVLHLALLVDTSV
jgi:hypothetical protein